MQKAVIHLPHRDLFDLEKINSAKSLLKNQAYEIIKKAIIDNRIKPSQIYSQEFISRKLGISRTPVREALLQLQNEGVVTIHRGRGMELVATTAADLRDIFEMSDAVECKACQLAAERMDDATLTALEEMHGLQLLAADRKDTHDFMECDHKFHVLLARSTGNDRLAESVKAIHEQLLRSGVLFIYNPHYLAIINNEHRAVLEALARRSPEESALAMRVHIGGLFARAMYHMEQMQKD
ncbi:MAG: GntR family transcriptional regulator [Acidaminococcales bacterium]|jgi:DNA-binding GntR family transcriptional regulator|nr:GntR family transcriptional regulator [Acidaminococcales bacterium]